MSIELQFWISVLLFVVMCFAMVYTWVHGARWSLVIGVGSGIILLAFTIFDDLPLPHPAEQGYGADASGVIP